MHIAGRTILLESITIEQLSNLGNLELANRMNSILTTPRQELYGRDELDLNEPTIIDFLNSSQISNLEDQTKKEALYLAFEFLAQIQINSRISGYSNHFIFNECYDENLSWRSPLNQFRLAGIQQAEIVLSRVAFERFMNLVYYIQHQKIPEVPKRKSKLSLFFEHLLTGERKFIYFLTGLQKVRQFDERSRTAEVHKRSKIIRRMLMLTVPSFTELNECHSLTNDLFHLWRPLIDILNNKLPTYIHGSEEDIKFLKCLLNGEANAEDVIEKIKSRFYKRSE